MILCGESSPVHRPDLSNTTRSVEDHVSQSVTGTTDLIPVDEAITARAPTNSGDGSTSG
jgi:hypothetical protein